MIERLSHVEQILVDWAAKNRAYRPELGFAQQTWQKITLSMQFDELVDNSDDHLLLVVDCIIQDLKKSHKNVLEYVYLGHKKPDGDIDQLLENAQSEVAKKLLDKGFYIHKK